MPQPPRSGRSPSWASLVAALPNAGLALTYLITWIAPNTFGRKMVAHLLLVMLLEFIVVHSAAFMGNVAMSPQPRRQRIKGIVFFGVFYTLFVLGFALAFRQWWPIFAFWGLTANRLSGVIVGQVPKGEEKALIMRGWAASVAFYILFAMVTTLLPVPALGVTREVIAAQEFTATGLWIDQPQRVILFGFLYFWALAQSELFHHRSFHRGIDDRYIR